ncbi:MAG: hypothetical protein ACI4OA_03345 [Selenomonadaceae bacterium]
MAKEARTVDESEAKLLSLFGMTEDETARFFASSTMIKEKMLRRHRARLLESIHAQQETLDKMDYMIWRMRDTQNPQKDVNL